jgi:hypothetical protein
VKWILALGADYSRATGIPETIHILALVQRQKLRVRLLPAILAHGIATHLDPVGVVNEPIEDTIGQRRITDLFAPA